MIHFFSQVQEMKGEKQRISSQSSFLKMDRNLGNINWGCRLVLGTWFTVCSVCPRVSLSFGKELLESAMSSHICFHSVHSQNLLYNYTSSSFGLSGCNRGPQSSGVQSFGEGPRVMGRVGSGMRWITWENSLISQYWAGTKGSFRRDQLSHN